MTSSLRRRPLLALLLAGVALVAPLAALAAQPETNTLTDSALFARRTGVAIVGTDPVAYFTDGKAVPGSDAFTTTWQGATWKFASAAHRDLFVADPAKYAPQYGGYCAYGVAQGGLVKIDPTQFTIRDGKLYLNYDNEVQKRWLKDPAGFIREADAKFPALLEE